MVAVLPVRATDLLAATPAAAVMANNTKRVLTCPVYVSRWYVYSS